jgi:putative hydroxymethylpyrimidine transport system ATP-binding protein
MHRIGPLVALGTVLARNRMAYFQWVQVEGPMANSLRLARGRNQIAAVPAATDYAAIASARTTSPSARGHDAMSPGIIARNLTLGYGTRSLLERVSFEIAGGEFMALLGTSGVGKSTLLKAIAGLTPIRGGSICTSEGKPITGQVAYMGQQDLLFPWLSVLENVLLGSRLRGERGNRERALHLLRHVGLLENAEALPAELSGGMRQRAALARTLYEDRPILLMDEPFSALDAITRAKVQDLASELLHDRTVLLITHDPLEACRLGHELRLLSGSPAMLSEPIRVPGLPPRAPDDPHVLRIQGQLLRMLVEQTP